MKGNKADIGTLIFSTLELMLDGRFSLPGNPRLITLGIIKDVLYDKKKYQELLIRSGLEGGNDYTIKQELHRLEDFITKHGYGDPKRQILTFEQFKKGYEEFEQQRASTQKILNDVMGGKL